MMTALIVLGVIAFMLVLAAVVWTRTVKAGVALALIKTQRALILDIEEKCMAYGYTDPLAYDIIQTIRDTRKKENNK